MRATPTSQQSFLNKENGSAINIHLAELGEQSFFYLRETSAMIIFFKTLFLFVSRACVLGPQKSPVGCTRSLIRKENPSLVPRWIVPRHGIGCILSMRIPFDRTMLWLPVWFRCFLLSTGNRGTCQFQCWNFIILQFQNSREASRGSLLSGIF